MDLEEEFKAVEKQYFADCDEDYEDQGGGAGVSDIEDDVVPDSSFDMSLQDTDENKAVLEFFKNACCTQECNKLIPKDMIVESRMNFMDLEKDQQDIVILSKIESGRVSEKLNDAYEAVLEQKKYGKRKLLPGNKGNIVYTYHKLPICRKMFLFLYPCGLKRFKNLLNHYNLHGVEVRKHGSSNKPSSKPTSIQPEEITKVVEFIKSVADRIALPLPGRLPKFKDYKIMKLPSNETKSSIYRMYIAILDSDERKISNRSFRRIWSKYVPFISVMKPADDLCDVCRGNTLVISQMKNCSDEVREEKLNSFVDHLHKARNQRAFYQEYCSNKDASVQVISFDFAQTVHYPVSPQQPGSAYFKAKRKCSVFGITNEKEKVQFNYLADESVDIGKGPNCVISILHHYLQTHNTANLVLFSDNCVGQNKNNVMLGYLMWRISKNLNTTISLNFLLTGHTKFSPDRFFGLLKSKYALSNVDNHEDLMNCVAASSHSGHNKAVSAEDVIWYDWGNYIKQFYKPLVGITSYHHFKISRDGVEAKLFADYEDTAEFELLLSPVDNLMPTVIIPEGLSLERQWYIYNNLRDLVHDKVKADSIAPLPTQKIPQKRNAASTSTKKTSKSTKKAEKSTKQKRTTEQNATSAPKKKNYYEPNEDLKKNQKKEETSKKAQRKKKKC